MHALGRHDPCTIFHHIFIQNRWETRESIRIDRKYAWWYDNKRDADEDELISKTTKQKYADPLFVRIHIFQKLYILSVIRRKCLKSMMNVIIGHFGFPYRMKDCQWMWSWYGHFVKYEWNDDKYYHLDRNVELQTLKIWSH